MHQDGSCKHCMCGDKAWLYIRLALAFVLVFHGYQKLFGGLPMFTGMLEQMGFPFAGLMAWIVTLLEFFGGLAIAVGAYTKKVAILVAIEFAVILLVVKKLSFPASDTDLLVFASAIALAKMGAGSISWDAKKMKKMQASSPAPTQV